MSMVKYLLLFFSINLASAEITRIFATRFMVSYPDPETSKFKTADSWSETGFYAVDYLENLGPATIKEYLIKVCQNLRPGELFRVLDLTEDNCYITGLCSLTKGQYFLEPSQCDQGSLFDIDKQACAPANEVSNCHKPFGDRKLVEEAQGVEEVTNDLTRLCTADNCVFPSCYCSQDGTKIPGNIQGPNTPQMILISFQGSVGHQETNHFGQIFLPKRKNPNGCSIKGTYFVYNKYSSYTSIEQMKNYGHEIASFSITKNDNSNYWTVPDNNTYKDEFVGSREILKNFANVDKVSGIRVPYLYLGGEKHFSMLEENGFLYDSTVVAPKSRVDNQFIWPYNLRFGMPHPCHSLYDENCPVFNKRYDVWEIPLNEIDRSLEDGKYLTACPLLSNCHFDDVDHFIKVLERDFQMHYYENRAPVTWAFDAGFFRDNDYLNEFIGLIEDLLTNYEDVYFVSNKMAIDWIKNPTPSKLMDDFELWKGDTCNAGRRTKLRCLAPQSCEIPTAFGGRPEVIYLFTCSSCPAYYPWIRNTAGINPNN